MECILAKKIIGEHKNIKDERYATTFLNCPLFDGRQICLWCCLHIRDIADPIRRGDYSLAHPDYESTVSADSRRDWDEIWSICGKCSK